MSSIANDPSLWLTQFPWPKPDGHKYDRGHTLIRGGEMTGAARLAARAALRMGSGLVSLAADRRLFPIYATALESVIVHEIDAAQGWEQLVANPKCNAIVIGPGLGWCERRRQDVLAALASRKTCVLDADALTGFADDAEFFFTQLHANCILTPHEGEFARLFGSLTGDKVSRAMQAAEKTGCVILLKGAQTVIAQAGQATIVNDNAPPWLATAGAGDVLAGMIAGLLAQNMPVRLAAGAAAWLHGLIATEFGHGLIAEDLIAGIPKALQQLATRV